ncbi:glycosyltransferase family 39 protein [Pseudarthrobacter sp. efr-133-R2A-89]|uniref:glycosyltransferase family 39 protein n=1 Tax=Pseudarthrobacter sp. efr-133-R2A-89 TaxID=3040302 RepID=UPI002552672C|nr:glycosyltransferase family 39 protein [Pseudarthrobacter sp. efr-133-R2A-89]
MASDLQAAPAPLTDAPAGPAAPAGERAPWLRRTWTALGAPAAGRRVPGTAAIAVVAAAVGFLACLYTTGQGSNLDYSDAQSHLTIARRVFDSKAPGFEQLGTVWLPMPHLLLMPFIINLWMFSSGWGACVLGIIALAATASGLYRICARLGYGRTGRLAAVLVLLANPAVLYTYTTALTEPVLLMCLVAGMAGLAHWATSRRRMSAGELAVFAGIPSGAAVLSRYEGWALVLTGTLFVLVTELRRSRQWSEATKMAAAYAMVPAAAVLWWLSYNWAIYGNPLEFMFGQYSAYAQQKNITDGGLLPTKGNLGLTLWTFHWSLLETLGAVVLAAAACGALVVVYRRGLATSTLLVAVTGSAYAFALLSLYLGQTAINNDHSLPSTWWNNRFALTALPLAAVLVAAFVHQVTRRRRTRSWVVAFLLLALAGQNAWWLQDPAGRMAILAEGRMSHDSNTYSFAAARWLKQHYDGGGILLDESARGNAVLPMMGIPLANIYNRAAGDHFGPALQDPAKYAKWVLVNVEGEDAPLDSGFTDLVHQAISASPTFNARYAVVFSSPTHRIYERTVN